MIAGQIVGKEKTLIDKRSEKMYFKTDKDDEAVFKSSIT